MYSCGPPHMDVQKQDDQHEPTYSNYVGTQDVTLKTCRRRWMIGRSGERGSGISVLAARHDDDDIYICWWSWKLFWILRNFSFLFRPIYIYIYIYVCVCWWSWKFWMLRNFSWKVMRCNLVLNNLVSSSFTIGWLMVYGAVFGRMVRYIILWLNLISLRKVWILRLRGLMGFALFSNRFLYLISIILSRTLVEVGGVLHLLQRCSRCILQP